MPITDPSPMTILEARRAEVAQYAANIAMYQAIAASMPSEWPEHLAHLKNVSDKHAAAADLSLEDAELVGDLWTHDDAQKAMRAETVEMRKASAILAVMESQA